MLYYALVFFVVARIASLLGLYGVAGLSAEIGYFMGVLALIFVIVGLIGGRAPRVGP